MLDPHALLIVLLATTGLTQTEAAALVGVAGRTMRRWIEGVHIPSAVAIDRLAALARSLDQVADSNVGAMEEAGSAPAVVFETGTCRPGPGCGRRVAILPWSVV
jgi:transcriptional regulator with XRE-family HTH domain